MAMEHPPFEDVFFIASLVFSAVIFRMACLLKHLNWQSHVHEKHLSNQASNFAMESSTRIFWQNTDFLEKNVTSTPVKPAYKWGPTGRVLRCKKGLTEKISWILDPPKK